MEIEPVAPTTVSNPPIILPAKSRHVEVPAWETARYLVFPLLEPVTCASRSSGQGSGISSVAPQTELDPLSGMLTSCIKMTISLFYHGAIIPLSESLIREWAVSMATVRLAMDANMSLVARSSSLESHQKGPITYYTVRSDAAPFNSALPFYTPFQETAAALLGSPFYFAVPERRTVVLFGREALPRYQEDLRNDILLTRDSSTSALSPELIEVSESGVLPVFR